VEGFFIFSNDRGLTLLPPADPYNPRFEGETGVLRQNNSLFWNVSFGS